MSNIPTLPPDDDGLSSYQEDANAASRVIQGDLLKFSNEGVWLDHSIDDEPFLPNRELVVVNRATVVQKWLDKMPVETRFILPGEAVPDIEALNELCPNSEWAKDLNNNLRGPWQAQTFLYMADLANMERFTFATNTVGGSIAIRELTEKTMLKRRLYGAKVSPVVRLKNKPMKTRFGPRMRPHFEIMHWTGLGPDSKATAVSGPNTPSLPPAGAEAAIPGGIIEQSSDNSYEDLNDDLPI
jgi:hypothetical protein